jgi:hypothetical protein
MALKSDRHELQTDISFFMDEAATRGGVAVIGSTTGSGAAMDQGKAVVTYSASASGKVPMGLLLNDMVDIDLTRQHVNWHKDEIARGGKVTLLTKGWVVTSSVEGTAPSAGDSAYVAHSGNLGGHALAKEIDNSPLAGSGALLVGRFLSGGDEDGYYKVSIDLPNTNV